jgi:MATE family multidrug resistance protein
MILANITTPLLGLVDTAVLGHLPSVSALAGASIGALLITQMYWLCGFLRMSLTGLSAQTLGQSQTHQYDSRQYFKPLIQGFALAILLSIGLILLQQPILWLGSYFSEASEQTAISLDSYFSIRILGAPAALMNLTLIGWLVGQQRTKAVMLIQILGNLLNAGLNLIFVLIFDWQVAGVAGATVVSEYTMMLAGLWFALHGQKTLYINRAWFYLDQIRQIFSLNTAMFLRNLILQLCLAFITFQGAQLGAKTAATNAILMQFFVLIALGLDGVAYAVEALVGKAKGLGNRGLIWLHTQQGLLWSSIFAIAYSLFFWLLGSELLFLLTDKSELIIHATDYLPLMIAMPVIAHWCFLFDGVFIGLSNAKAMRNTMLVSATVVFFPVWLLLQEHGNWALWLAFLAFLGARGVSLAWVFYLDWHKGRVLR